MIDSIVLELEGGQFTLEENNKFYGTKSTGGEAYLVNARDCGEYLKSQQKKGVYFPFIRLPSKISGKKKIKESLEIQVSLQKLVHKTSLYEIDENDLENIFTLLLGCLQEVGITTTKEALSQGVVRRADFSKVIKLPSYLGKANQVVYTLSRFNSKPYSDFTRKEFYDGSEGIAMKFWNSTQGYVIYDKFGEIISNGFAPTEKGLSERVKNGVQQRNAIKFEISLQRKTSFEAVVKRHLNNGKQKNFTLKEILNRELAKGILLDAFDKIFSDVSVGLITLSEMEENRLLAYLESSKMEQNAQIKLFYWVRMATIFGIKGTWERIDAKYSGGSVARTKLGISKILIELGKISGATPNLISFLRQEHEDFVIIKPKS